MEPMHRAGRQVHQSARFSDHVFVADADCDVAAHHVVRTHPKDGSAAEVRCPPACLAENFVTTSSGTWCKNRDLLADDIKRGGPGRGCDNERFGHGSPPVCCFGICQTDGASSRPADMLRSSSLRLFHVLYN